jgi:hypothetical protein
MEVQAMKSGVSPRDPALLKQLFDTRVAELSEKKGDFETWRALNALAEDFAGLQDVKAFSARAKTLERDRKVQHALDSEIAEVTRENNLNAELYRAVRTYVSSPSSGIKPVRDRVEQYARQAKSPEDSTERRMAKRILAGLAASSRGIDDPEFQKLIATVRPPRPQ